MASEYDNKPTGKKRSKKSKVDSTDVRIAGSSKEWTKWWTCTEETVAGALEDRARMLWEDGYVRREEIELNLKRWGITLSGLYLDDSKAPSTTSVTRLNITKSLVETITAKIGKLRPRPLILTDGGTFANKIKAKKLQRFVDAVYQQTDAYQLMPQVFRSAMLCGTGVLAIGGNAYRNIFTLENCLPIEFLVDAAESSRGEKFTRSLIRTYPRDKDELMEDFPDFEEEIERAPVYGPESTLPINTITHASTRDIRTASVTEAWRKARYDAKGNLIPGRHVLACNGSTLLDEEWCDTSFPFVFFHWSAPERGFWGASAVAEIRGLEYEANVNLQRGQEAMRRGGMSFVLAHVDSELKETKLTNEPGTVIRWAGQVPPQVITPPAVSPQILEQPDRLLRMAANQLGTNELQISASKPAGVESGRAMEQLSEEHTVRFDTVSKAFEHAMSKALAVGFVSQAKRMDTELKTAGQGGLRLRSTYKKEFIDLKWGEVELGENEMFIDVWPVSVLPHTPAGRTAEVERWQNNTWLSPDEAKELLEFPDIESFSSVSKASRDLVEWQIASMLDDGKTVYPDERQDLEYARRFGTLSKLRAIRENFPDSHIALLEDFLATVEGWIAPPPPMPETAPMGEELPLPEETGMPGMGAVPAGMDAAALGGGMGGDLAGQGLGQPGMGATAAVLPGQFQMEV